MIATRNFDFISKMMLKNIFDEKAICDDFSIDLRNVLTRSYSNA
jgi:hypothetical protein